MALVLSEEQQLLRDSAKTFLQERSPVEKLRELRDSGQQWSPGLWAEMADMGWAGIAVPEAYDGLDFGYVGAGLILEECGKTLAASPLLSSAIVSACLIESMGTADQKNRLLPAVSSGELILTLALNEGPRLNPSATAMIAEPAGDEYILNGVKAHVLDGMQAEQFMVVARTGGKPGDQAGLSIFLVDRNAQGVNITSTLNADNRLACSIEFDAVQVNTDALLGEAGGAWAGLQKALDIGAACSASEMLGLAQEAFERTIQYLKERKQFGVLIGSFQSLQHRAAVLFCELDLSRSLVLKALQAIDENSDDCSLLASAAKVKCAHTAKLAVNEAVQMHGGIGMTDEFDIGFFIKRSAAARQEYGDVYYHSDRFAALKGY